MMFHRSNCDQGIFDGLAYLITGPQTKFQVVSFCSQEGVGLACQYVSQVTWLCGVCLYGMGTAFRWSASKGGGLPTEEDGVCQWHTY